MPPLCVISELLPLFLCPVPYIHMDLKKVYFKFELSFLVNWNKNRFNKIKKTRVFNTEMLKKLLTDNSSGLSRANESFRGIKALKKSI